MRVLLARPSSFLQDFIKIIQEIMQISRSYYGHVMGRDESQNFNESFGWGRVEITC
jgi:hypothetical protein